MKYQFTMGYTARPLSQSFVLVRLTETGELIGGILTADPERALDLVERMRSGGVVDIPDWAARQPNQLPFLEWEGGREGWDALHAARAEWVERAAQRAHEQAVCHAEANARMAKWEAERLARWEADAPARAARAALREKRRAGNEWMLDCGFTPQQQAQQTADEFRRRVLRARAAGATYREIGEKLGVSTGRAQQIGRTAKRIQDYADRDGRPRGMGGPVPKFLAAKAEIFDTPTTRAIARRTILAPSPVQETPKSAQPSRMAALREPELMI